MLLLSVKSGTQYSINRTLEKFQNREDLKHKVFEMSRMKYFKYINSTISTWLPGVSE